MQSVSRVAAVHSSESLLFVVGNKVCMFFCTVQKLISHSESALKVTEVHFSVFTSVQCQICPSSSYVQLITVSPRGPGCAHFINCSDCLAAPKFIGCSWCDGVCSQKCEDQWSRNSCPPVITQVTHCQRNMTKIGLYLSLHSSLYTVSVY